MGQPKIIHNHEDLQFGDSQIRKNRQKALILVVWKIPKWLKIKQMGDLAISHIRKSSQKALTFWPFRVFFGEAQNCSKLTEICDLAISQIRKSCQTALILAILVALGEARNCPKSQEFATQIRKNSRKTLIFAILVALGSRKLLKLTKIRDLVISQIRKSSQKLQNSCHLGGAGGSPKWVKLTNIGYSAISQIRNSG